MIRARTRYLQLVLWPNRLTIDYGDRAITGFAGVPGLVLLGAALLATVRAWMRPNQWGWLAFLGAWFFLILAPSSSVVPIITEVAAERRIYLALAAVMTLVVVGFLTVAPPARWRTPVLVAVAALCAATTFARSRTYSSVERLWHDAAEKVPTNARAWEQIGVDIWSRQGRRDEARELFRRAIATDSTYAPGYFYAATVAVEEGNVAEAIDLLRRAIANYPHYTEAKATLGSVLLSVGDAAAAIPLLEEAAQQRGNTQSLVNLGAAYTMTGRSDDALQAYLVALDREPGRADVLSAMGGLLLGKGEFTASASFLERAISLSGGTAFEHALLAMAYAESDRRDDAARAASKAAGMAPADASVLVFAGRAMARSERKGEAEQYLRAALRADPGNREALAALAALGRR
jgi:tetratricopeptide (TPR) repeat protein